MSTICFRAVYLEWLYVNFRKTTLLSLFFYFSLSSTLSLLSQNPLCFLALPLRVFPYFLFHFGPAPKIIFPTRTHALVFPGKKIRLKRRRNKQMSLCVLWSWVFFYRRHEFCRRRGARGSPFYAPYAFYNISFS